MQKDLSALSVVTGSLVELQRVLNLSEHLQDRIEQEHHTLTSLQHHMARLLWVSNLQQLKVSPQICADLQSVQGHCRRYITYTVLYMSNFVLRSNVLIFFSTVLHSIRDQSSEIRRKVLFEIQELGQVQEEMGVIQQNVLSLLNILQSESAAERLQVGALQAEFVYGDSQSLKRLMFISYCV